MAAARSATVETVARIASIVIVVEEVVWSVVDVVN
jgi:hypothetical protein